MFGLVPYSKDGRMDLWNHRGDDSLFRIFDEFEKNFWNNSISDIRQFRTDIMEKEDHYLLSAELPGFQKEDIQLQLEGDTLVISASQKQEIEENNGQYIRRERRCGTFSRSFDISGLQADKIRASYENGVLSLELPKKQPDQGPSSRQIPIQ